ncbi:hypothetical protein CPG37_00010 [Malaciobacter canalis]|uniref:Uncharacterized protein n=1 Tax=Malaciobacter canalis TaxID=1912871 RepID=A0ABX4LSE2_9BACT|nr:hypothetical protein [Malaciobacter canalis]PHO10869.1 hypothetical protein CPG37_00010 [Malaciobacter canalis]QEE32938.1 hypothetical protein ACAN_1462 [Malaciobacter canalis]
MSINIYSSIYEKLIDSNNNLSVDGLLAEYKITPGQLKTILVKIKENEYLAKEKSIIEIFLDELKDYNQEEIEILVKKKEQTIKNEDTHNKIEYIKKVLTNLNLFFISYINRLETILTNNRPIKKRGYIIVSGIFVIIFLTSLSILTISTTSTTSDEITNEVKVKINDSNSINKVEKKQLQKKETLVNSEIDTKLDTIKIIKNIDDDTITAIIDLNQQEQINPIASSIKMKKEITKEIKKEEEGDSIKSKKTTIFKIRDNLAQIKKHLMYENNMIKYKNKYYKENDILEGYKVFKITPVYVKFEDMNKKIRKRVLLN